MNKLLFGLVLGCGVIGSASALDEDLAGWHPFIVGGLTRGGDVLLTTTIIGTNAPQRLYAGNLVQMGAGAMWTARDLPLSVALSANVHIDDSTGANGTAQFLRLPVEAIGYYVSDDREWRGGLGLRYVFRPRLKSKITNECSCGTTTTDTLDVRFKNTVGLVAETGWAYGKHTWINFRVVRELYTVKSIDDNGVKADPSGFDKFNGSHYGVNILYAF